MKKQIRIARLVTMFFVSASLAQAQVAVDPAVESAVADILAKPAKVFQLDLEENSRSFGLIDKWFGEYIDLGKATRRESKQGSRISFKLQMSKNTPVLPTGEKVKAVDVERPFNIRYIKEPQKRSFIKELQIPTRQSLSGEDVAKIGSDFINANKLCKITSNDRLGSPLVISRKRHEFKPDMEPGDELTIFQRVEFKREFFGLEVINSKQIVDIHPDSREIVSYKNIMWTPVDTATGKSMPYVSQREVMAKINSAFVESKMEYKVVKVKVCMFQTDKIIFPVLVVYTQQVFDQADGIPEERVLIIDLVRDLGLERREKELERPAEAR